MTESLGTALPKEQAGYLAALEAAEKEPEVKSRRLHLVDTAWLRDSSSAITQ